MTPISSGTNASTCSAHAQHAVTHFSTGATAVALGCYKRKAGCPEHYQGPGGLEFGLGGAAWRKQREVLQMVDCCIG